MFRKNSADATAAMVETRESISKRELITKQLGQLDLLMGAASQFLVDQLPRLRTDGEGDKHGSIRDGGSKGIKVTFTYPSGKSTESTVGDVYDSDTDVNRAARAEIELVTLLANMLTFSMMDILPGIDSKVQNTFIFDSIPDSQKQHYHFTCDDSGHPSLSNFYLFAHFGKELVFALCFSKTNGYEIDDEFFSIPIRGEGSLENYLLEIISVDDDLYDENADDKSADSRFMLALKTFIEELSQLDRRLASQKLDNSKLKDIIDIKQSAEMDLQKHGQVCAEQMVQDIQAVNLLADLDSQITINPSHHPLAGGGVDVICAPELMAQHQSDVSDLHSKAEAVLLAASAGEASSKASLTKTNSDIAAAGDSLRVATEDLSSFEDQVIDGVEKSFSILFSLLSGFYIAAQSPQAETINIFNRILYNIVAVDALCFLYANMVVIHAQLYSAGNVVYIISPFVDTCIGEVLTGSVDPLEEQGALLSLVTRKMLFSDNLLELNKVVSDCSHSQDVSNDIAKLLRALAVPACALNHTRQDWTQQKLVRIKSLIAETIKYQKQINLLNAATYDFSEIDFRASVAKVVAGYLCEINNCDEYDIEADATNPLRHVIHIKQGTKRIITCELSYAINQLDSVTMSCELVQTDCFTFDDSCATVKDVTSEFGNILYQSFQAKDGGEGAELSLPSKRESAALFGDDCAAIPNAIDNAVRIAVNRSKPLWGSEQSSESQSTVASQPAASGGGLF